MKKVFLVKKDPNKPADADNWIVMDMDEFRAFADTPEGSERKKNFGQLDGCDTDDVIIFAECGEETAAIWRAEKDHRDYLTAVRNLSGYRTLPLYGRDDETGEDVMRGDLLRDRSPSVEETVILKIMTEKLRIAITTLDREERDLVDKLMLSEYPMTEREYAELLGVSRNDVHNRKLRVIRKLRQLLAQ